MRKYIIGAIIGLFLSYSAPVFAETVSLIGRTIEGVFAVQVDGKKLEKEALVVDGTTYLPVRAFGEAIGYEVSFDPELGVSMKKKVDPAKAAELEKIKKDYKIKSDKEYLQYYNNRLKILTDELRSYPEDKPVYKQSRDATLAEIEKSKAEIQRLEKELAELEAQ